MKTLYIDCGMGAAGDMLTAALLELLPDREAFLCELNAMGIPGVRFDALPAEKCGICGTHMSVAVGGVHEHCHGHEHEHFNGYDHEHFNGYDHEHCHEHEHCHGHEHRHNGMDDIVAIVQGLGVPDVVKADVLAVYRRIAEAESHVHGVPTELIHFHEVGALDAVADIAAVCLLMNRLAPKQIVVSPVHIGCGTVRCAHGILPVPAPATAEILKGIPVYSDGIQGELCTPTGAALLAHFATRFGQMPPMRIESIGYGMGQRDFDRANCVRAVLGESDAECGDVAVIECNVDDMTPEALAFAAERLLDSGALDAFTTPAVMKKGRMGAVLTAICPSANADVFAKLMFRYTTTLGVRMHTCRRMTLDRHIEAIDTPYGTVRRKVSSGAGCARSKLEYDDVAGIAAQRGISLDEARQLICTFIDE